MDNWLIAIILTSIAIFFQNIVAQCLGLIAIDAMDQCTMMGTDKAVVNYINCAEYDTNDGAAKIIE